MVASVWYSVRRKFDRDESIVCILGVTTLLLYFPQPRSGL